MGRNPYKVRANGFYAMEALLSACGAGAALGAVCGALGAAWWLRRAAQTAQPQETVIHVSLDRKATADVYARAADVLLHGA